jgi:hypothetical protein
MLTYADVCFQLGELATALGPQASSQLEAIIHQHLPIFHTEHCMFFFFHTPAPKKKKTSYTSTCPSSTLSTVCVLRPHTLVASYRSHTLVASYIRHLPIFHTEHCVCVFFFGFRCFTAALLLLYCCFTACCAAVQVCFAAFCLTATTTPTAATPARPTRC